MLEREMFGSILITSGIHKGKTGFYDDDETIDFQLCSGCAEDPVDKELCENCKAEEEGAMRAVVYLGAPFKSDYTLIRYSEGIHLPNEMRNLSVEKLKRDHPDMCRMLGIDK